jgi:hypothetical protein
MTLERLKTFSKREQLLFLMSEFERARVWQAKNESGFKGALERGFKLLDLMFGDPKWREELLMLLTLRSEMAKFYIGERTDSVGALSAML